jgi:hypothetical protein
MRWNKTGLSTTKPLLLARNHDLKYGSVNCLLHPESQWRASGSTLLHSHELEAAALLQLHGGPIPPQMAKLSDAEVSHLLARWGSPGRGGHQWPLLPLDLCQVHRMPLKTLRDMQLLPSLMYRLEVRATQCRASYQSTGDVGLLHFLIVYLSDACCGWNCWSWDC